MRAEDDKRATRERKALRRPAQHSGPDGRRGATQGVKVRAFELGPLPGAIPT
jgi:hypothetical protein